MANRRNLDKARSRKQDEFYTRLSDIENELKHYRHHFKDKVIYCNCDDPRISNFFHYFSYNFELLGLKKLITTCYRNNQMDLFSLNDEDSAIYLEYEGEKNGGKIPTVENIGIHKLEGDGDFRSEECIELLKEADIVITNPPFSLFREYVAQLIEYDKKFLILGNMNAITYKEFFPLLRDNKIWSGYKNFGGGMDMIVPPHIFDEDKIKKYRIDEDGNIIANIMGVIWYSNLDNEKRNEDLVLFRKYKGNEDAYPKYDNYDAINVDRVKDIPMDYTDGVMGVPITFLSKHNPKQFEIIGLLASAGYDKDIIGIDMTKEGDARPIIDGKVKYSRILIKRKASDNNGS